VRAVCRAWRTVYDASVTRLVMCADSSSGACAASEGRGSGRGAGTGASNSGRASNSSGDGASAGGGASKEGARGAGDDASSSMRSSGSSGEGGTPPQPPPPPLLPLVLPNVTSCTIQGLRPAVAASVLEGFADAGSPLTELRLESLHGNSHAPPASLESALLRLGATLRALRVADTPLPVLPAGLERLEQLQVGWGEQGARQPATNHLGPRGLDALADVCRLDRSCRPRLPQELEVTGADLLQLPERIAAALPALRALRVPRNQLTELPPLPAGLHALDVSWNRLKSLDKSALLRLTGLTSLHAVGAFSHRPHEGAAAVSALAALAAARHGDLALRCDGDVAELVRGRARLLGQPAGGGGGPAAR
jgi:hypothetical protein